MIIFPSLETILVVLELVGEVDIKYIKVNMRQACMRSMSSPTYLNHQPEKRWYEAGPQLDIYFDEKHW